VWFIFGALFVGEVLTHGLSAQPMTIATTPARRLVRRLRGQLTEIGELFVDPHSPPAWMSEGAVPGDLAVDDLADKLRPNPPG
jgi:hypothetical protein